MNILLIDRLIFSFLPYLYREPNLLLQQEVSFILDVNKSEDRGKINQETLRRILMRAYMRGENISNLNTKDIIEEIAQSIRDEAWPHRAMSIAYLSNRFIIYALIIAQKSNHKIKPWEHNSLLIKGKPLIWRVYAVRG